jgi:hypothetical protein
VPLKEELKQEVLDAYTITSEKVEKPVLIEGTLA